MFRSPERHPGAEHDRARIVVGRQLAAAGSAGANSSPRGSCSLHFLVLLMGRGGKRPNTGPKPKMDEESVVKRQKRLESKARTAQRKADAAAAAEQEEEAEQQKALLRKERTEQPMCLRRSFGSERVAAAKAAAAATDAAAAVAAASTAPRHEMNKIYSFFVSKPAPVEP